MPRDTEIIRLAFELAKAVETLMEHARRFYYEVALSAHACPRCGESLIMIDESRCRCIHCSHVFDPTIQFQRCSACGGRIRLRISRYQCRDCRRDVPSRFVFDGIVFDREYFREKMAESRERKRRQREHIGRVVVENRSGEAEVPPADLSSVPGLLEALNGLASVPEIAAWAPLVKGFDLDRYQDHIEVHLHLADDEIAFDDLPPLDPNPRLDRIWRFIAIIFMAHAGLIHISQHGPTIQIVRLNETNPEGS